MRDKRVQVYPAAWVYEILPRADAWGQAGGRLTEAIECWARAVSLAGDAVAGQFDGAEWCMLADVLNGTIVDTSGSRPGMMAAANVEDGHRLDGAGYRWFPQDEAGQRVGALSAKLHALDFVHGWAVILATRWFWDHCQDNFPDGFRWWEPQVRREWDRAAPGKEGGVIPKKEG